ncbi:TraR/DksA C4-type zinc finger protein [Paenibacillus sp. DMB20]|uniref:TraR/DksA C4-type zinc finger protein n=1 Tax=Paenibacillus sp. DMB20 TaxID=1642570 RepID=UPI000627D418|nr:TraR/DksA C4-type zinc finger protein [Paenibacillus sp. DMB20]KKO53362.1 conjugal transfer protein TraR [Paenibacillus sp. DMB20]
MNHLNHEQLHTLKQMLLDEKKFLENHFEASGEKNALLGDSLRVSTGELSSVDNHPADVGTETFERGRDLAVNETLNDELDQISAALDRMEKGTYGTCAECGSEIPYKRLEALPYTAYCVKHAPDKRLSGSRPVEEDVITPPLGRAGVGRRKTDGRFDDAEAWEAVEDFGTATSPVRSFKPDKDDDE